MISNQQMERAEQEFASAAHEAIEVARCAELRLENLHRERQPGQYIVEERAKRSAAFEDADYMAESRAWILSLIREDRKRVANPPKAAPVSGGVPHNAVCYFNDGDQVCAVFGDFINLQESPAGFGKTMDEALDALQKSLHATAK